jgi:hypothetical protein
MTIRLREGILTVLTEPTSLEMFATTKGSFSPREKRPSEI